MDMSTITPTEPAPVAGIVLAGGLSSRMGQDKALLRWRGRTLLEHSCALLESLGAHPVRVSGDYPGFDSVPDSVPRCGPLGGLHSVVETLADGPAWVVPVDMPLLDVTLLRQLAGAGAASCVTFCGEPVPMYLNIDGTCRSLLFEMVTGTDGPRSLRMFQRRLGGLELPLPAGAEARLVNCNTPRQWEEVAS
ncbi:molybdenum cofactor guanylyltransferase [Stenotrophomonas pigmentata]|jgi:molybdopterin-guanine dinucleotide biosynthesis protein A|uniref:molybdenum cofactor guanylyltransferase n=1 Tax=Stenotrophomonas pigmentata TaxID=3055080 RepID=UPI0026EB408B|nr:molybdenum cofactor guanylyltransferase [Stenotrophomonas sp. 610A2]